VASSRQMKKQKNYEAKVWFPYSIGVRPFKFFCNLFVLRNIM
jgi:hypothetical protein